MATPPGIRMRAPTKVGEMFRTAGWAPVAVLLASFPLGATSFAESLYPVLHLLGGAALAYFFRRAVRVAQPGWVPVLSSLVAFSLACTGAVFWEIGEFVVDEVAGTALQEGIVDTMTDLILAAAGAAAFLALRRCVRKATVASDRPVQDAGRQRPGQSAENRTARPGSTA